MALLLFNWNCTLTKEVPLPGDTHLELTEAAIATIGEMQEQVIQVALQYGQCSEEHCEMVWSLLHALIGMIRLGGRITTDYELSLYCVSPTIHYGVNFSAARQGDQRDPLRGTWSLNS